MTGVVVETNIARGAAVNWNQHWEISDLDLGMLESTPDRDLRQVANDLPVGDVTRALEAARAGRLIRGAYQDNQGRGCLLHFLTGVCSKRQLLDCDFSEEAGLSARRLVRYWDYGAMTSGTVVSVLEDHLAIRRDANASECRAIALANRESQGRHTNG